MNALAFFCLAKKKSKCSIQNGGGGGGGGGRDIPPLYQSLILSVYGSHKRMDFQLPKVFQRTNCV